MKTRTEKATVVLEQADKFRALKKQIAEGMEDVAAGRVSEWNYDKFLRDARTVIEAKNSSDD